ncbi:MAG TPA: hypothetical protein GX695_03290 [Acholeplasmataceae bacterium]|nr:hypothetical protein [Acholeplasmataceae bacterium]
MEIRGKIIETFPSERLVKIKNRKRIYYVYLTRKFFRDFGPYFYEYPYVIIEVGQIKKIHHGFSCFELTAFKKVTQFISRSRKVFFDIDKIRESIKTIVNKDSNLIFLDLEFSLPSYNPKKRTPAEIIQYGLVLTDSFGNVITASKNLVKPNKFYSLNKKTLRFLNRDIYDFEEAVDYIEFYQILEKLIKEYDAKIIAWGRNDIITMEKSFKINRLYPLELKERYINIMQLMKTYYNLKNDLGLFDTYQMMVSGNIDSQTHDAYEDAVVMMDIFFEFKKLINE